MAKAVELHSMSMEGGIMKMRRLAAIDILADQPVSLKPGGLHIMLVGLACVIGLTAIIAIVRALRARSTFNENRMMRDYLRRIASDRNPDFRRSG